jgi:hypothetical protein
VNVLGVLSPSFSFSYCKESKFVRASRAFLWRKKEPQFPFFIVLWISSIDQPKNIGDIGLLSIMLCKTQQGM